MFWGGLRPRNNQHIYRISNESIFKGMNCSGKISTDSSSLAQRLFMWSLYSGDFLFIFVYGNVIMFFSLCIFISFSNTFVRKTHVLLVGVSFKYQSWEQTSHNRRSEHFRTFRTIKIFASSMRLIVLILHNPDLRFHVFYILCVKIYNRRGWDSNPRGETPMD